MCDTSGTMKANPTTSLPYTTTQLKSGYWRHSDTATESGQWEFHFLEPEVLGLTPATSNRFSGDHAVLTGSTYFRSLLNSIGHLSLSDYLSNCVSHSGGTFTGKRNPDETSEKRIFSPYNLSMRKWRKKLRTRRTTTA